MNKPLLILIIFLISFESTAQQWSNSGTNIYSTNTGNVGIGTAAPLEKLHINGSIRGNISGGALRISTTSGYVDVGPMNTAFAHFYTNMTKYYFDKPVYADGGFSSYSTNDMLFMTNGTTRMNIGNSNGYVGIGVTTPATKLEVNGTISMVRGNRIQFLETVGGANRAFIEGDASNQLKFHVGSSTGYDAMVIDDRANIGVGIAVPAARLDIGSGNQRVKLLTGTNTSAYELNIGVNDDGVNFYNNSNVRGYKFTNINGTHLFIDSDGDVGLGVLTPAAKLDIVSGSQRIKFLTGTSTSGYELNIGVNDDGVNFFNDSNIRGYKFSNVNGTHLLITPDGNVGIGSNPDHKLDVRGTIHAQEVLVDMSVPGPDYVFEESYDLPSLKETEAYIKENKHLPEIPSAKEMEENGLALQEMNVLLLKKVEELTLYLIRMEKTIQQQNERIQTLENTKK